MYVQYAMPHQFITGDCIAKQWIIGHYQIKENFKGNIFFIKTCVKNHRYEAGDPERWGHLDQRDVVNDFWR